MNTDMGYLIYLLAFWLGAFSADAHLTSIGVVAGLAHIAVERM